MEYICILKYCEALLTGGGGKKIVSFKHRCCPQNEKRAGAGSEGTAAARKNLKGEKVRKE